MNNFMNEFEEIFDKHHGGMAVEDAFSRTEEYEFLYEDGYQTTAEEDLPF